MFGYIDSLSSTITSILTKRGREVLARNDGTFRITKWKVADDEVNYQLYNPTNIDSEDADILAIPILEPSTDADTALRFPLVTMPEGTKRVAELSLKPNNILFDMQSRSSSVNIQASTLYNEDDFYIVSFTQVNSTYVNSISLVKDGLYNITQNSGAVNSQDYSVSTDHNLQLSKSSWNVVITFKAEASKIQVASNVLLASMIVLGQQSGVFTTIDLYGNIGASEKTFTGGSVNDISGFVTDPSKSNVGGIKTGTGSGGVRIIGENL